MSINISTETELLFVFLLNPKSHNTSEHLFLSSILSWATNQHSYPSRPCCGALHSLQYTFCASSFGIPTALRPVGQASCLRRKSEVIGLV